MTVTSSLFVIVTFLMLSELKMRRVVEKTRTHSGTATLRGTTPPPGVVTVCAMTVMLCGTELLPAVLPLESVQYAPLYPHIPVAV